MTRRYDLGFLKAKKVIKTIDNIKDGARCRVRTCDPIRVKDVLYH
jgi:hypothetical protein